MSLQRRKKDAFKAAWWICCPAPKRGLIRTTHVKRIKDAVGSKSREISAGFPSENKSEKLVFLEFSNTSLKWPIMLHVIQ